MRKYRVFFLMLCLCLLFAGCGQRAGEAESGELSHTEQSLQEERVDIGAEYASEYRTWRSNDLFADTWQREEIRNSDRLLRFTDYIPGVFPGLHQGNCWIRGYCSDAQSLYALEDYYWSTGEEEWESATYLRILDAVTREVTTVKLQEQHLYTGFYQSGGRLFSVIQGFDEDGYMNEYCAVEIRKDGTCEVMCNLYGILKEQQMLPDRPNYVAECTLYYEPESRHFYLISPEEDRICVVDSDGNMLSCIGEDRLWKVQFLTSAAEGRLLFVSTEDGEEQIFSFDGDEQRILFQGEPGQESAADCISVDCHGRILFGYMGMSVIDWDIQTGSQERVYVGGKSSSFEGTKEYYRAVMRNESGEILILKDNNLSIVTAGGPSRKVNITVQPLLYVSSWVRSCFSEYERTHPGVKIELLETPQWQTRDSDISRLFSEIAQGEGPDMLILDRNQMELFDQNDCLTDLSEVLPDKTKQQLIRGFEEYGRTENGLMLMAMEPKVETVFLKKSYRKGDTWMVKDILDLLEEREKEENPLQSLVYGLYEPLLLFTAYIADTELVDVEKGTCYFDSELFIRCLEACKRYRENSVPGKSGFELMRDGDALLYSPMDFDLVTYGQICSAFQEDFVTVGYPGRSGIENRIRFSYGFSVNRNSGESEAIRDFLNWFYSLERSYQVNTVPLRKDTFDNRLVESSFEGEKPMIRLEGNVSISFDGKPDGATCIRDYMDFLDSCTYAPADTVSNDINRIVLEEADVYFQGGCTAQKAASMIQSRVSLYLKENR